MLSRVAKSGFVVVLMLAAGCGLLAPQSEPPAPPPPAMPPAADATPGAIFQSGREVAWLEDIKARRVGDSLTIRLQESTQASKTSSTQTKKETSVDNAGPTLLGRPVTVNGTPVLQNALDGQQQFQGTGASSQSNSLDGSITVTVVDRLPNGNLVVQGEKWLTLNQGDEFIRITGIVRPYDIATDNTVTSDKIGNARISYSGRGTLASANKAGWLAKFFNSPWMPF
ncbi:MAG TPA: flagellar basal body L-ring protein FlgH [Steroidobacteraceae bacterium]|nr:flagellar basal body L-ring protein FlgH [Steroidobacteraceae bacterium]